MQFVLSRDICRQQSVLNSPNGTNKKDRATPLVNKNALFTVYAVIV